MPGRRSVLRWRSCTGVYVLAQNSAGLVLVDMHAAHERILYEQLKKVLDGAPAVQRLLIPAVLAMSAREIATAFEYAEVLESWVSTSVRPDRTN
jgi:DNA mismatch repair protein MutL